jgi:hypothetical protein
MWFVEFETAVEALTMLFYTRGRQLRNVPIAARLKSNTLLTGVEYKGAYAGPSSLGNHSTPVFSQMHGMPQLPPDVDHEGHFGISMPYRRFPTDESYVEQEAWTSPSTPGVMAHGSALVHHYQSGTYLPPNFQFQGAMPFAVPANTYGKYNVGMQFNVC